MMLYWFQVQLGTPVASGFTSHYTLVRKKRASPEVCRTEQDFAKVKGINTFFPIVKGEEIQGDEIVVFESAHVLPRFVVHYSVVCLLFFICGYANRKLSAHASNQFTIATTKTNNITTPASTTITITTTAKTSFITTSILRCTTIPKITKERTFLIFI